MQTFGPAGIVIAIAAVLLTVPPVGLSATTAPEGPHACYYDGGLGTWDCGLDVVPRQASTDLAAIYTDSFYGGSKLVLKGLSIAGCSGIKDFDFTTPALSFWDNKASSIQILDPTCRVAGWDLGLGVGRFLRCTASTLGTAHEAIGIFTISCADLGLLPPNWNDSVTAVRLEPA